MAEEIKVNIPLAPDDAKPDVQKQEVKTEEVKKEEVKNYPTLDEIKKLLDESIRSIQKEAKKEEPDKKLPEVKTEVAEEPEVKEPTGEKIELNFGANSYIIQPPSDWEELDRAKLRVLIEDAVRKNQSVILDKAIKVIEVKKKEA